MSESNPEESPSVQISQVGFPAECWPALVESLLARPDMYVAMTDLEWRVQHANPRFAEDLDPAELGESPLFFEALVEHSATALSQLHEDGELEGRTVELNHRTEKGIRVVAYNFRRMEGGWLAVGRDLSVELELVQQMSALVGDLEAKIDLEKAARDELRTLVGLDPLTGLANRRQLEAVLSKMADRFHTQNVGFAVLCLDLDHFKLINDTHGHLIGDEVLRRIGKTLSRSIRGGDSAARYGGEEFVLVINTEDVELCKAIGERIRRAVESTPMPEPVGPITVSVGAACTKPDRQDLAPRLLELADRALYAAKQDGRNRVYLAAESLDDSGSEGSEALDEQPA